MEKPSKQELLTSAFVSIVQTMQINDDQISKMLQVDPDYMQKLREQKQQIELKEAQGKSATQFILAMESLYSLVGRRDTEAINWLNQANKAFDNRTPLEVLADSDGITKVASYLKESAQHH